MSYFMSGFYKSAETLRKEVSTVAVMKDGKMLMGKRRDNNKYTAPGGHLDKGEDPLTGAVRELYEESGIEAKPSDLKFIRTIKNKENGYIVHGYEYHPKSDISTSMKNDPDGEVFRWSFMNTDKINDKDLHVPRTKGNVLLEKTAGVSKYIRLTPTQFRHFMDEATSQNQLYQMALDSKKKKSQKPQAVKANDTLRFGSEKNSGLKHWLMAGALSVSPMVAKASSTAQKALNVGNSVQKTIAQKTTKSVAQKATKAVPKSVSASVNSQAQDSVESAFKQMGDSVDSGANELFNSSSPSVAAKTPANKGGFRPASQEQIKQMNSNTAGLKSQASEMRSKGVTSGIYSGGKLVGGN